MNNFNGINEYNSFSTISKLPYDIACYLIQNNDELWKLINYNTSDALMQPSLTFAQKEALIYNGQPDSSPFRLFFYSLGSSDDVQTNMCAYLRMYVYHVYPRDKNIALITFQFDCISNSKIIQLSDAYHSNRSLKMMENVLSTLNGRTISDGIGNLFFDAYPQNSMDAAHMGLSNSKSFEGYYIRMSCWYSK